MKIHRPNEVTPEIMASLRFGDLTPEELKEAYSLAQAAFTAEDLQRYTEVDGGVAAEDVLRDMEEAQKKLDEKRSS